MKNLLFLALMGLTTFSKGVESSRIDFYNEFTCQTHAGYRSECGWQPLSRQVGSVSVEYNGQAVHTYVNTDCSGPRMARYDSNVSCDGNNTPIGCVCIECGNNNCR